MCRETDNRDCAEGRKRKGQTSIILILIVILIFGGLVIFLLTFAQSIARPEYTRLYATNIMLSVMRVDTGYMDSKCRLVSDAMACAFFEPDWKCGGDGPTCLDLVNATIKTQIDDFELIQKSYRYLFIAAPIRLDPSSGQYVDVLNPRTNEPLRIKVGDLSLETSRVNKIVEPYSLEKMTSQGPIRIKAQIMLSQKAG
jgi:hypothetical protein